MEDSDSPLSSPSKYAVYDDSDDDSTPPPIIQNSEIINEKAIQNSWQTVYVYAYAYKFCNKLIDYPPEDFEQSLELPRNELLENILLRFLSNALNRKKLVEKEQLSRAYSEWISTFKIELMKRSENKFDYPIPDLDKDFFDLNALDRLAILRELVDTQLQVSIHARDLIETNYNRGRGMENELIIQPVGKDSDKIQYYQIGNFPRVWAVKERYKGNMIWKPVCTSIQDLKELAYRFGQIRKRAERELFRYIMSELLPRVEEDKLKREKLIQKKRKQAILAAQALQRIPRLRERRKPVRYYDEYVDDEGESDSSRKRLHVETELELQPRQGTRRSTRRKVSGDAFSEWQEWPEAELGILDTEHGDIENDHEHEHQSVEYKNEKEFSDVEVMHSRESTNDNGNNGAQILGIKYSEDENRSNFGKIDNGKSDDYVNKCTNSSDDKFDIVPEQLKESSNEYITKGTTSTTSIGLSSRKDIDTQS